MIKYFCHHLRPTVIHTETSEQTSVIAATTTSEESKKESKNRNAVDDSVLKCVVQQSSRDAMEGVYKKALSKLGMVMTGEKMGDIPRNENFV